MSLLNNVTENFGVNFQGNQFQVDEVNKMKNTGLLLDKTQTGNALCRQKEMVDIGARFQTSSRNLLNQWFSK
jgi:hypothetical protein